jgi:3-hydroxyisobutyrate dehydrogenase-like beta-hydroxyacid dehydrogenase
MKMKLLAPELVKIGFIGLGNMGSRIAQRLLNNGYHVTVYDRDQVKTQAVAARGAIASDVAKLARTADVICSCLSNDEAVQSVYYGNAGVIANAQPGTAVLELSTVFPKTSVELHQRGSERDIRVLDVAISGSTPAAEQGSLTLLVGGDAELFEAAQPLFRAISARSFHMGPAGAGTTMKLVVNTLLGVGMQAIAEAIPLGEKGGIERNRLLEVLAQTAVIAPAHAGKLTRVAHEDYSPQFPLRLMNKDFHLILEKAKSLNVSMPATNAAFGINSMEWTANPDADFSAVVRRMEELAQVRVPE